MIGLKLVKALDVNYRCKRISNEIKTHIPFILFYMNQIQAVIYTHNRLILDPDWL